MEESVNHLFFKCPLFVRAWIAIIGWLGYSMVLLCSSCEHLEIFTGLFGGVRVMKQRMSLVWFASEWGIWIWKSRNAMIFN